MEYKFSFACYVPFCEQAIHTSLHRDFDVFYSSLISGGSQLQLHPTNEQLKTGACVNSSIRTAEFMRKEVDFHDGHRLKEALKRNCKE